MNTEKMLSEVLGEIDRLTKVADLLRGFTRSTQGKRTGRRSTRRRKLSPEARERIAAAQRARWAKFKKSKG